MREAQGKGKGKRILLILLLVVKWGISIPRLILATVIVDAVLNDLPHTWHRLRSPSFQVECRQIRPGMTLSGVLTIVETKTQPNDQIFDGKRARFYRKGGVCAVDFDPGTKRVSQVVAERAYIELVE